MQRVTRFRKSKGLKTHALTAVKSAAFATVKLPRPDVGLKETDPEMAALLQEEIDRQKHGMDFSFFC